MTAAIFARLATPFDPSEVDWRVGHTNAEKTKGMALAYIDARAVMHRLDEVLSPAGWSCEYPHAATKTVCRISLKIDGEWIGKEDGAGDSEYEAEKGALSDAFKRAAVRWGVGRYLYDFATPWVPVEARGKSFIITAEGKRTLEAFLRKPQVTQGPTGIGTSDTMMGRKNEAKGLLEAREWVNAEALPSLAKMKARTELTAWLNANEKRLNDLETAFPDQYKALDARISKTQDRLMEILAAG